MPELITHTSFAYLIRNRKWDIHSLILYLIGAMLPDLMTRPFYTFFPSYKYFVVIWHTPIVLALWILIFVQFFEENFRKKAFILISFGVLTHYFLDLFQIGIEKVNYNWLFPFSDFDFQIGLFWPEDSLYFIPIFLLLVIIDFFLTHRKFQKKR